ncbi:hypothetical protein LX16_4108 [Stackebrandtia albiflava]|uniref:Histone deacetylase n=1 Tax=Stackebrandtia albiflava TaxID=406432 RepID=A0A562UYP9_9ACTN|nr:histone deacetylase [Stackebrandtia albiflava]TWJ10688.1 hypothetical protein LX16_4108 [Stackebrandtia albiflava]
MPRVWYVSYGSNLNATRFACYLRGGTPDGGTRRYPGCRDTTLPAESRPLWLDGGVYFAGHSPTWSGGMAFYDPDTPGPSPARGHLITVEQFADVCAQEMRRDPGTTDIDLAVLCRNGRLALGPGRYETLLHLGSLDGTPMVTFTAPAPVRPLNRPSPAYLATIAAGLRETFGWTATQAAAHLAGLVERSAVVPAASGE